MKVLITGGAGFIGVQLGLKLAAMGATIHLLDNVNPNDSDIELYKFLSNDRVTYLELDCLLTKKIKNLDKDYTHIIHLAAILGVANVLCNPDKVLNLNAQMTINLVELAKKQKNLNVFLFASTSEVYAGSEMLGSLEFPTSEESIISLPSLKKPRTSYMLSKLYGEAIVQNSGLPYSIFRPHNIYGPRMGLKHVIPQLFEKIHLSNGTPLEVYSPEHSRTFCFIEDAIMMITALMTTEKSKGEIVNIGTESPEIKMKDLAKTMVAVAGKNIDIRKMFDTDGSPRRRVPSMKKCFEVTGYRSKVSLNEGLEKTYEWYDRAVFNC